MAISVTGSLKVGYASYSNPQIQLIPHLTYRGMIAMDAVIVVVTDTSGSTSPVTTIPYYPIVTGKQDIVTGKQIGRAHV